MKKNFLNILLLICSFHIGLYEAKAQSAYPVLYNLFEESDLIVQGMIVSKDCHFKELGVESCRYGIKVDSIFKGKLSDDDYLKLRPDSPEGPAPISNIISFHHNCFSFLQTPNQEGPPKYFEDICYEQGHSYIVFLQKQVRSNNEQNERKSCYFSLTDQWLGVQPANTYMALDLREWAKE